MTDKRTLSVCILNSTSDMGLTNQFDSKLYELAPLDQLYIEQLSAELRASPRLGGTQRIHVH